MEEPPLLSFETLSHPDDSGISLETPYGVDKKTEDLQRMRSQQDEQLQHYLAEIRDTGALDDYSWNFLLQIKEISEIPDHDQRKERIDSLTPELRKCTVKFKWDEIYRARQKYANVLIQIEDTLTSMNGSVPASLHKTVRGIRDKIDRISRTAV